MVISGVPQGSFLGPILVSIYVLNDLPHAPPSLVVQYTSTVTVRISHVSIRTDGKDRQQEVDNSGLWFIERGILHLEFAFLGFCACVGLWFIERGILQLECAFLAVRIVIMRCTLRMSAEVLDMCGPFLLKVTWMTLNFTSSSQPTTGLWLLLIRMTTF